MPHTDELLTEEEQRVLTVYRRAAGKVHRRLGPWARHRFTANIFRADGNDSANLIPDNDFAALLAAVRLVYAVGQDTHFGRIANILWRVGDPEIRRLIGLLRSGWKTVLSRPIVFDLHNEDYRPQSLLDTWLNGEEFHMGADLLRRVDLLQDAGPMPLMVLQFTVRDLCYPILGLDNVCAMVLGERLRPLPDVGDLAQQSPSAG